MPVLAPARLLHTCTWLQLPTYVTSTVLTLPPLSSRPHRRPRLPASVLRPPEPPPPAPVLQPAPQRVPAPSRGPASGRSRPAGKQRYWEPPSQPAESSRGSATPCRRGSAPSR